MSDNSRGRDEGSPWFRPLMLNKMLNDRGADCSLNEIHSDHMPVERHVEGRGFDPRHETNGSQLGITEL